MGKIKKAYKADCFEFDIKRHKEKAMFMKNEKKKMRPLFAIGVGALTVYGAYSMVSCIKNACCKKVEMLTKVIKNNKNKKKDCSEDPECDFET